MNWETVIGLEVHAQLATKTKIFSGASTAYGAEPNTQACAVDLGLPGTLPVFNEAALKMAIRFGLAVRAKINPRSIFARKNYFYPDLPKGYQISQFDEPTVTGGELTITQKDGTPKTIHLTRAHLEEDAGKSLHENYQDQTGIDLNRAGTPLLEIVSEPELRSAHEAVAYLKTLHSLVRYLGICDGNLQEGSFRCDVNISVRPLGQSELGTRAEIKNINSFRFVEKAIHYETERQIALLESGEKVVQETRLFDANTTTTRSMRSKEDAHDYRYFPDPDLLPVIVTQEDLEAAKKALPELPWDRCARFESTLGLSTEDAAFLSHDRELADYFEAVIKQSVPAKIAANWIMGEVTRQLNDSELNIFDSPVSAQALAALIARVEDNTVSNRVAKDIFSAMWQGEGTADEIIAAKGLKQISDSGELEAQVDQVIADNPKQWEELASGKEKMLGFFVGQVMKATGGKANPKEVNVLIQKKR